MAKKNDLDASDMMIASERINTGLLNNNIHFLNGEINEFAVENAIKWILYENTINEPEKVLTLYINSVGGNLSDAFALVDIMRNSNYPIRTIGIGSVISAGFLIFACGEKGQRIISKNTSIMCHQYSGGMLGKQHDMEAYIKEMELTNNRIVNIFTEVTGMDLSVVKEKLLPPSDVWMTPDDLIKYGVADIIS